MTLAATHYHFSSTTALVSFPVGYFLPTKHLQHRTEYFLMSKQLLVAANKEREENDHLMLHVFVGGVASLCSLVWFSGPQLLQKDRKNNVNWEWMMNLESALIICHSEGMGLSWTMLSYNTIHSHSHRCHSNVYLYLYSTLSVPKYTLLWCSAGASRCVSLALMSWEYSSGTHLPLLVILACTQASQPQPRLFCVMLALAQSLTNPPVTPWA